MTFDLYKQEAIVKKKERMEKERAERKKKSRYVVYPLVDIN